MKTKTTKTPNKNKPAKKADKKKPAKKVTRVYKSVKTAAKNIKSKAVTKVLKSVETKLKERNDKRQAAIERAAAYLRSIGQPFDKGNFLLIASRLKIMFAFDYPVEMRPALERNADTTKHGLLYVEPANFKTNDLELVLNNMFKLLEKEQVKPKATKRLKKLSKPLDRNLAKA